MDRDIQLGKFLEAMVEQFAHEACKEAEGQRYEKIKKHLAPLSSGNGIRLKLFNSGEAI